VTPRLGELACIVATRAAGRRFRAYAYRGRRVSAEHAADRLAMLAAGAVRAAPAGPWRIPMRRGDLELFVVIIRWMAVILDCKFIAACSGRRGRR
jgi:hypothetical protein